MTAFYDERDQDRLDNAMESDHRLGAHTEPCEHCWLCIAVATSEAEHRQGLHRGHPDGKCDRCDHEEPPIRGSADLAVGERVTDGDREGLVLARQDIAAVTVAWEGAGIMRCLTSALRAVA